MVKSIKAKPVSALHKHTSGECGCSVLINPNFCIYQPFLDGWDFTPDVGNGGKRGEIFTPRFIVDKMIAEAGIIPEKALYEYDYTTVSKPDMLKIIRAKVNEPAVGTANFTATILWHKIHYVKQYATSKSGKVDLKKYNLHLLEAIASMYSNDIDAGNLQTTKWRLLRFGSIYTEANVKYWTDYIYKSIPEINDHTSGIDVREIEQEVDEKEITETSQAEESLSDNKSTADEVTENTLNGNPQKPIREPHSHTLPTTREAPKNPAEELTEPPISYYEAIEQQVRESLNAAAENWGDADEDKGVIDVLYKKHTGQLPLQATRELWMAILDENIKLFNGIVEEDTIEEGFIIPGWFNIKWTWWQFNNWHQTGDNSEVEVQKTIVPLAKQLLEGQQDTLTRETKTLEAKQIDVTTTKNSIEITTKEWATPEDKKNYLNKRRQLRKIQAKLESIDKTTLTVITGETRKEKLEDQLSLF